MIAEKAGLMSDKIDLQSMLLEIQDDEASDTGTAIHLSQDQIQELVTKRKAHDAKQAPKSTDAL